MDTHTPYYTSTDVAKILNIPTRTARRYLSSGRIPAQQNPITKIWSVTRGDLLQFAEDNNLEACVVLEPTPDTRTALDGSLTYLNNAATSFPKPPSVIHEVTRALSQPVAEPGRVGGTQDLLQQCRSQIAELFGVGSTQQVVLTPSATVALNLTIQGLLKGCRGAHVISSELEHNSVLRPLEHLKQSLDLRITYLEPNAEGLLDPNALQRQITRKTRLIALTHASNVTGAIQPLQAFAQCAANASVPLLIDAAQSAGCIPMSYTELPGRVFVACAGHKGLLGPSGTGVLLVPDADLPQLIVGGTGVYSAQRTHPQHLPLRHEAGTANIPGFAGLSGAIRYVQSRGVQQLGHLRHRLVMELRAGLAKLPRVRLAPLAGNDGRAGIVCFTVDGIDTSELGYTLREVYGIELRSGLHCAPMVHKSLGTLPSGNLRASLGPFNTSADVNYLLTALQQVSQ